MPQSTYPRFLNAGESALVVEFGESIDPEVHDRVLALDRAVAAAGIEGVLETVPTYRSLLVNYDPERLEPSNLAKRLAGLQLTKADSSKPRRRWIVPACYAPAFSQDLDFIASSCGLTPGEVVALHSGAIYRIYMYGFAPGLAYLGGLPASLNISRRAEPRQRVAACSLLIAGGQALIATVPMPTGWHIIGRTPEHFFSPGRDPIFLAAVGDEVTFESVDEENFLRLEARAAAGEVVARIAKLKS
jgi:inhibitor of KinA